MANFSAHISFKFSSNVTKVGNAMTKSFRSITKAAKQMTSAVRENEEGFAKLLGMIKRLMLIGLAALAAAFSIAVVKAQEYESSLLQLSAITGIVGKELNQFGNIALQSSVKLGTSAGNYLEAVQAVASAKPELLKFPEQLRAITDEAGILAKAADLELGASARALTDAMNQFELGAGDASRAINVLAAGSKFGASLVGESATALVKAGVAAKLANSSFEETNAAIQILALRGIKGAIAGTQLRGTYLRLNKVIDDTDGINNASEALDALANANLSGSKLTQLFGMENVTAAKILIDSRKRTKEMTKAITGTAVAYEQADIVQKGFGESVKRMRQGLVVALILGFKPFIDALKVAITGMAGLFKWFIKYPKVLTVLITLFGSLIAVLGVFAVWLGIVAFNASALGIATLAAAKAVIAFNLALLANPLTWVIVGVVALTAAVVVLAIKFKWFRNLLIGLALLSPLAPLVAMTLLLIRYWNQIAAFFKGVVMGVLEGMKPVIDELKEAFFAVVAPVMVFGDILSEVFDLFLPRADDGKTSLENMAKAGKVFGKVIAFAFKVILFPLRVIVQAFMFLVEIGKIIGNVIANGLTSAMSGLQTLADRAMKILQPILDAIKTVAEVATPGKVRLEGTSFKTFLDANRAAKNEAAKAGAGQTLDVNMKIDAEGRPSVEKVESSSPDLTFSSSVGLMIPGTA